MIKEEKEQEKKSQTQVSEEDISNHQEMLRVLSNPSEQTYNILGRLDLLIKNGELLNVLIERLVIAEEKRNELLDDGEDETEDEQKD